MKKIIYIILLFLLSFYSCQYQTNNKKNNNNIVDKNSKTSDKQKIKKLVWIFNPDKSNIYWTGYKTTEKKAVHGEFKQFDFKGINQDIDLINTLLKAQVSVNVFSIFSGNESRDKKLIQSLFQKMVETDRIEGRVYKINRKENNIDIVFNLNAHEKKITMQMQIDKSKGIITLTGKLNLLKDFEASDALAIFHQACKDKHTGKDGISKTWGDVDVKAILKFDKN